MTLYFTCIFIFTKNYFFNLPELILYKFYLLFKNYISIESKNIIVYWVHISNKFYCLGEVNESNVSDILKLITAEVLSTKEMISKENIGNTVPSECQHYKFMVVFKPSNSRSKISIGYIVRKYLLTENPIRDTYFLPEKLDVCTRNELHSSEKSESHFSVQSKRTTNPPALINKWTSNSMLTIKRTCYIVILEVKVFSLRKKLFKKKSYCRCRWSKLQIQI